MYCYYLPLCHLVAVHCTVEDGKILNGQGPLQGRGKKNTMAPSSNVEGDTKSLNECTL